MGEKSAENVKNLYGGKPINDLCCVKKKLKRPAIEIDVDVADFVFKRFMNGTNILLATKKY